MVVKLSPIVSILIANYNCAEFLCTALDSVAAQTFRDFECIIVDDASIDNSIDIIKKYVKRDKRFHLIQHKTNRGLAAVRNTGLDAARGEYIAFLDSDDAFTENAIKSLYMNAKMYNADITGGAAVTVPSDFVFIKSENPPHFTQVPTIFFIDNNPAAILVNLSRVHPSHKLPWVWRRLFKRKTIETTRFDEAVKQQNEDLCFMLDAFLNTGRYLEINDSVMYHRINKNSITGSPFGQSHFLHFPATLRHLYGLRGKYPENLLYKGYMQYMFNTVVITALKKGYGDIAARTMRRVYRTPYLPLKYLSKKQRLIFWLFMHSLIPSRYARKK
ncbi:MAG: glycosyltransferase [Alphaproteobacteria bacterium]|nr:glycosyltransferase [Alphaproteobacteria bacterium]